MSCIYKITNLINNKVYIGLTKKSSDERFKEHKSSINKKSNINCYLPKSIKYHGAENFICECIVEGDFDKESLNQLEKYYTKLYNSNNKKYGYNLTEGGIGIYQTKESIHKGANTRRGRKLSDYHIKRIRETRPWGRIVSEETKEKLKAASKRLKEKGHEHSVGVYVEQYDLQGVLINKYSSIWKAARELKIDPDTIRRWSSGLTPKIKREYTVKIIDTRNDKSL